MGIRHNTQGYQATCANYPLAPAPVHDVNNSRSIFSMRGRKKAIIATAQRLDVYNFRQPNQETVMNSLPVINRPVKRSCGVVPCGNTPASLL